MIINLKYNSQTGLLSPIANYTLAQHNHLADKMVIVSNASDCKDYNYCLEFVCYNTKNVPKAHYVSEILTYSDEGIEFEIPNNLTQYAGFVDVQLTGYSKDSNNIVFKSISKNTKAFSVEGSLSVLDNALSDTPNIITLLQQELDYVREVKETIANDFENLIKNDLGKVLEDFEYLCVEFVFYEKRYSKVYKRNSKITPPCVELTDNEQLLGWVDEEGRQWDFGTDTLQDNMTLIANICSQGLIVEADEVKGYVGNSSDIYVPYYYDGHIIAKIAPSFLPDDIKGILFLPAGLSDCGQLRADKFCNIVGGKDCVMIDGVFYAQSGQIAVGACYDRLQSNEAIWVENQTKSIENYAFFGAKTDKINLPQSIVSIGEYALGNCANLEYIVLPRSVQSIGSKAFYGCSTSLEVEINSDQPPKIDATSFDLGQDKKATVLVPNRAYSTYKLDELFSVLVKPLDDTEYLSKIVELQNQVDNNTGILSNLFGIGSVYMSTNSTSPASLFGGTWERIKDRFLLGAGDSYIAGATGGSADSALVSHDHYLFGRNGGSAGIIEPSANAQEYASYYGGINDNLRYLIAKSTSGANTGITSTAGESGTGKNMPPYLTIYMWKRIA